MVLRIQSSADTSCQPFEMAHTEFNINGLVLGFLNRNFEPSNIMIGIESGAQQPGKHPWAQILSGAYTAVRKCL
jgi:hypothetical protein